jgi:8-oxo-dGTP pyrophosphatase MutT (NUDIX family)
MKNSYHNPWRTLGSREVYDNPWIRVREDTVLRPDGKEGIYGVVSMKNRAIAVLPVHEDGSVTLVGQFRYTLGQYEWEIPEGGGPYDEEPEQAARRELLEETGLVASTWSSLGRAHLSNSVTDEEAWLFVAMELEQREAQPEGTEDLQIRRVPWDEALAMVMDSRITDSLSIIAILRYEVARHKADHDRAS